MLRYCGVVSHKQLEGLKQGSPGYGDHYRVYVEINIAWDNAYQILFGLGERGGKRIVNTILASYLHQENPNYLMGLI